MKLWSGVAGAGDPRRHRDLPWFIVVSGALAILHRKRIRMQLHQSFRIGTLKVEMTAPMLMHRNPRLAATTDQRMRIDTTRIRGLAGILSLFAGITTALVELWLGHQTPPNLGRWSSSLFWDPLPVLLLASVVISAWANRTRVLAMQWSLAWSSARVRLSRLTGNSECKERSRQHAKGHPLG